MAVASLRDGMLFSASYASALYANISYGTPKLSLLRYPLVPVVSENRMAQSTDARSVISQGETKTAQAAERRAVSSAASDGRIFTSRDVRTFN